MNIRTGTLADLSRLATVNSMGSENGIKIARERLPAFIEASNLIVAEEGLEIVGLLYWKREFLGDKNWFLVQVTVAENYRRRGVGEKLWRYLLSEAKTHGAKYVFADIAIDNDASMQLAQKLGGISAGSIDLGEDDTRNFYRFDLL